MTYNYNKHEKVIWLTKTNDYYFDLDAVREPYPEEEVKGQKDKMTIVAIETISDAKLLPRFEIILEKIWRLYYKYIIIHIVMKENREIIY